MSSDPNVFKAELKPSHATIKTSTTLDEIKQMLIVQYWENDQWTTLSENDYSLEIDTPFLSEGSDSIVVNYNGWSYNLDVDGIESNQITEINVNTVNLGEIFTSVTESEIKDKITVTAHFLDNTSVILNSSQYSITWLMSEWSESDETMTFIVSINYGFGENTTTFEYEMNALEIDGTITAEWTNEEIQSYFSRSELASSRYFTVKATFNDGVVRELPYYDTYSGQRFEFGISGSTLSKEEVESFTTMLDVYYVDDPNNYDSVQVTVKHVMPTDIDVSYEGSWVYEAFTRVNLDSLEVKLRYDSRTLTLDSSHYTITYSGASGDNQSFRVPVEGNTSSITVTVIEYGEEFKGEVSGFTVIPSTIVRPDMDDHFQYGFTGDSSEPHMWQIYGYDEERMQVSISSDGNNTAQLVEIDDKWYIQAVEAGTYTVSISPIDQSVKWNSDPQQPVVFHLTITGAEMTLDVFISGDTVYNPDGISYGLVVEAKGLEDNPLTIDENNISYSYNGTKANGDSDSGDGLPTQAGDWTIYITVSGVDNYQEATTSTTIVISKKVLEKPYLQEYDYDENQHEPALVSESEIFNVSGNPETNAGEYQATVAIKEEHSNNYCWDASSPTDSDTTVTWKINTASNSVSSSMISGWTYFDDDDVNIESI